MRPITMSSNAYLFDFLILSSSRRFLFSFSTKNLRSRLREGILVDNGVPGGTVGGFDNFVTGVLKLFDYICIEFVSVRLTRL